MRPFWKPKPPSTHLNVIRARYHLCLLLGSRVLTIRQRLTIALAESLLREVEGEIINGRSKQ